VASTIDELVGLHTLRPALIKIDVEGAEYLVFKGARETLRAHRPVILSELADELLAGFGSTSRDVIRLLEAEGYEVMDAIDPTRKPGERRHGDILCIPR
jgi:hypothetical protein